MSIYSDKLAHIQIVINCRYSIAQICTCEEMLDHYSEKLAHVQVIINCQYTVAQMCTCEDQLAHILDAPCLDHVMSYNSLTTLTFNISHFYSIII